MANIVVIGKYYHPFRGGIEANTKSVADCLAKRHNVTVIANNHERGKSIERVGRVLVMRRNVHFNLASQPIALNLLDHDVMRAADIVHVHSPNPYAAFSLWLASRLRGLPVVVTTHHMDIHGRKLLRALVMPFSRWLLNLSATVFVASKKNVSVSADLPLRGNYVSIPLGVDPNQFEISEETALEGKAWRRSLAGDAPVIGFVGRHARYKGLQELVEAVALLPGVHAMIAGDGPHRAEAEAAAKLRGVSDRVHFVGLIDHRQKLQLLSAIDAFVFPSTEITEAFGISQLEAMLCGTPVVASDLPTGVTDIAIEGETALLAPPRDAVTLAKRIGALIDDPELAARLTKQARRHVLDNFVEADVSERAAASIEQVLRRSVREKLRRPRPMRFDDRSARPT